MRHLTTDLQAWRRAGGAVVLLLAAGAGIAACGGATGAAPDPAACGTGAPKLTVQGTGIATGSPNELTVAFDVRTVGPTAQQALAGMSVRTGALVAALVGGGVARGRVQTTGLSLQPDVTIRNGTVVTDGYAADETVLATSSDLSTAGAVIDDGVAAGGTDVRIDSMSFMASDSRRLQEAARHDAVDQAVGHASAMAAAAGERLGPVCSLVDDGSGAGPDQAFGSARAAAPAGLPSPVPIAGGTQQVTAQVTLVYALRADSARG